MNSAHDRRDSPISDVVCIWRPDRGQRVAAVCAGGTRVSKLRPGGRTRCWLESRTWGALAHRCSPSRQLRKVDDAVRPVPAATLTPPEVGHQARLVAVVGAPNAAAEQDEATVTLARSDHLACMPRKRCSIECDEHQTGLRAGRK